MNLQLHGVRLRLGTFHLAVDIELTARVTGIFGASGAGKTSLLEVITGLRRPDAGTVRMDGQPLNRVPPHRRNIGYVPQDGALFPHLTVRGNLQYGMKRGSPGQVAFDHVVEVLEIAELLDRRIATLSGGEQRRVACARALLASPHLLLLDEPLAGLDRALKDRILPYLRRIRDEFEIPMLYVTHDASEVAELCEGILVLERGRCVRHGLVGEVLTVSDRPGYELRGDGG